MANDPHYRNSLRDTRMAAVTTDIGTSGILKIYSGTIPANCATAITGQTLLSQHTCSATFAAAPSTGVITANAIGDDTSADATGVPTFFRIETSGGACVYQNRAGASGSGEPLTISTAQILTGGVVSVTSLVLTEGNA